MSQKIALVTGANKGIGFEIAKQLLQKGFHVIVTARNSELGTEAVRKLGKDASFLQLDVLDNASVQSCASAVKNTHNMIDVLVNNAGVLMESTPPKKQVRPVMNTNLFGVLRVSEAFFPLIRDQGRVVNVSSQLGALSVVSNTQVRKRLAAEDLTIEELTQFANQFIEDVESGKFTPRGYQCYGTSKAFLVAMSKVHARQLASRHILVNAYSPGYCATDMTGHNGIYTAAQGADTAVFLSTANITQSGEFFASRNVTPW